MDTCPKIILLPDGDPTPPAKAAPHATKTPRMLINLPHGYFRDYTNRIYNEYVFKTAQNMIIMNIAFFLGAGASVMANMPTTNGLLEKLERRTDDPIRKEILSWYRKQSVELLYSNMENYPTDNYIVQHLKYVNQDGTQLGYADLKNLFMQLKRNIRDVVIESLIPLTDVHAEYSKMINGLHDFAKAKRCAFIIITTNYDLLLDRHFSSCDLVDGFCKDDNDQLHMLWTGELKQKLKQTTLLKIHGSINWQKTTSGRDIEKLREPSQRETERDVIIAPTLNKKDYTNTPFRELNDRFEEIMLDTNLLVVIGSAFSDEGILDIFKRQVRRNDFSMISISPDSSNNAKKKFGEATKVVTLERDVVLDANEKSTHIYTYDAKFEPSNLVPIIDVLEAVWKSLENNESIIDMNSYVVDRYFDN